MKNQGWIKENIRSVLSIMWTTAAIAIFIIVLLKDVKSDDKLTYLVITLVGSIVTFNLGYYFGASKQQIDNAKAQEQITPTNDEKK